MVRARNLTPPIDSYLEAQLEDAKARFRGVQDEINVATMRRTGVTKRRLLDWAQRLEDGAKALREIGGLPDGSCQRN